MGLEDSQEYGRTQAGSETQEAEIERCQEHEARNEKQEAPNKKHTERIHTSARGRGDLSFDHDRYEATCGQHDGHTVGDRLHMTFVESNSHSRELRVKQARLSKFEAGQGGGEPAYGRSIGDGVRLKEHAFSVHLNHKFDDVLVAAVGKKVRWCA